MIRPTTRAVWLFAAGIPLALLPTLFAPSLWVSWMLFLSISVLVCAIDALRVLSPHRLRVELTAPDTLFIGREEQLVLRLAFAGAPRATTVSRLIELDEEFLDPIAPDLIELPQGDDWAEQRLRLRPRRRGTASIRRLWLRWRGPWGLFERIWSDPCERRMPVVPDVLSVRAMALRFFGSPRAQAGWKTERFLGDGSEFESLRKYVPGLDPRGIDWKASARHLKLLVRNFRAERNHQVVMAIDTGHLMREPLAGVPRLDHAVNSALLLSYFCLHTGDRVGLYGFDARPRFFLEPVAGRAAFPRLQQRTADLEYGTDETNYTLAMMELGTRLRRRSLVIVFTDFSDSITAELMLDNLDRLARKHVVLFVALDDPGLEDVERARPDSLSQLGRSVVAADLRTERRSVLARLRRAGVHVLDTQPGAVSLELVNRYLDIKRRELV